MSAFSASALLHINVNCKLSGHSLSDLGNSQTIALHYSFVTPCKCWSRHTSSEKGITTHSKAWKQLKVRQDNYILSHNFLFSSNHTTQMCFKYPLCLHLHGEETAGNCHNHTQIAMFNFLNGTRNRSLTGLISFQVGHL